MGTTPGLFGESLWDQALFGGDPGDPPEAGVAASSLLEHLYPRLHANGASDLLFWTEPQLLEWMDRSLRELCRKAGIMVSRSTRTTANGAATYELPSNHVSTLQASWDGTPLVPSSTSELSALDSNFTVTAGMPKYWYEDTIGLALIGLSGVPTLARTLAIIHHNYPEQIGSSLSQVQAPRAVIAWIETYVLAEAYNVPSDSQAMEVAGFFRGMAGALETVVRHYWGESR